MRVLAIDPGERRLGLAISDPTGVVALPLEVIVRAGWARDLARLRQIVAVHGVTEIVVGRPLTMRGDVGEQARAAAAFAQRVRTALRLPVHEVDERFSTVAAQRAMHEAGARKIRGRVDAVAAALILQAYLDRTRARRGSQAGSASDGWSNGGRGAMLGAERGGRGGRRGQGVRRGRRQ
ncbi:MAG: Holliday junction resolvase RuvX [Armatimonadota bacterium]|nr:Holliday junction resolvase RuvX [Armatimonadota bacterium]MDR7537054.1 Holliday junction resolvase RuvX [Armatimonadota bacterium]